ncbi:MAG: TetR family transcriptional regulator [Bacilli bacterium]|nr:TetR family transcriptional regulator [Bacilli bacterium]
MPKQMFFNISPAKQKMFLNVAIEEFTTKSFELVSVNSIIKKANISRGSFYTYFTDLDELFNYIIEEVKKERLKYMMIILETSKGDFFEFVKNLFAYDFDQFQSEHRYSLFRNYIYYIQMSQKGSIKDTIIKGIFETLQSVGFSPEQIFDLTKYNISIEEILDVAEMIMLISVNTFMLSESCDYTKEEILSIFERRLNIFQYGVLKR